MRTQPLVGAGALAVAAALKPYAFAWFLPAIGFGGMWVTAVLAAGTAVLWTPLLLWWGGPAAFFLSQFGLPATHIPSLAMRLICRLCDG